MNKRLTKTGCAAFVRRWKRVAEIERDELRRTNAEYRLRQAAALMASVDACGWRAALHEGEEDVRQRWMQLRRHYGA